MKHSGSISYVSAKRSSDLVKAYRELLKNKSYIISEKTMAELVNSPAPQFYISEERAAIVISAIMNGRHKGCARNNTNEMFEEIYRRAMLIREKHPELTIYEVAERVVMQPAPKFYITPESARVIINREKRKWFEQRKKILRHLF